MRGDQADLLRPQRKHVRGAQIGFRLRLVGLHDLGAEDRIPRQAGALGHFQHEDDVAVGQRRDNEALLEPGQAGGGIRPWVQPMPSEVEFVQLCGC